MAKNPNPQGKGGSLVLSTLDVQRQLPATLPPKQVDQISAELFTSLFVLESRFRFKPVRGQRYFLYRRGACDYWLALTPPRMLGETVAGRFIGVCTLQSDMTWTLTLSDEARNDPAFLDELERKRRGFEQRLQSAAQIEDLLPVYERGFDFYRRASAFALAYSLSRSMKRAGIHGLSYDRARGLLAGPDAQIDPHRK
ncbi:DUF2452 domain-containing protein [Salinisphaera sp.]|uniref:DUF2452 domain-containing protein n=1 Tax=Salinisphaera sp. TaxID=1914330 RepID=UPI000C619DF8|nr:DUF2452 domain-containing protein [Salinisphaera sp.]MBS62445.1 hypothetical protein [Salinisphaera sp.]